MPGALRLRVLTSAAPTLHQDSGPFRTPHIFFDSLAGSGTPNYQALSQNLYNCVGLAKASSALGRNVVSHSVDNNLDFSSPYHAISTSMPRSPQTLAVTSTQNFNCHLVFCQGHNIVFPASISPSPTVYQPSNPNGPTPTPS